MQVELISTTAADGVKLDGAWHAPRAAGGIALDALVCVHGTGSNFYGSSLLTAMAAALVDEGVGALVVNTRGHDAACTLSSPQGPLRGGAAYEIVDDCRLDLAAWLRAARERGAARVGLFGHSLGALKSLYYAAHDPEIEPACVVAVSAPRLSHEALAAGPRGGEFLRAYGEAQAAVARGAGEALVEATFPFPYVVTARSFLDKYGPGERYDLVRLVGRTGCPLLAVYGGAEIKMPANVAFHGTPEVVEAACAARGGAAHVAVIAGGDHFYAGTRRELTEVVLRWLRRTMGS